MMIATWRGSEAPFDPLLPLTTERLSFRQTGVTGRGALKTSRNAVRYRGRLAKCLLDYVLPRPGPSECGAFVEKRPQAYNSMILLIYLERRPLRHGQFLARVLYGVQDL